MTEAAIYGARARQDAGGAATIDSTTSVMLATHFDAAAVD